MIVAAILDLLTSNIFFVFFSVGGVIAIAVYLIGLSFLTQLLCFLIVSIVLILLIYPYVRKNLKRTVPHFSPFENKYIGQRFTVPDDIEEEGEMKIGGIYWRVKNTGEPIKKGNTVEVIGIEDSKFLIKKVEDDKK
ncbi:NfeD family protein [Caldanaerobius polysaccharolyticus]|uniref:NfeD family protein n=1 Tax=Caldanaerobius polysaccharolyticus TaxID=44256 RepID=UPI00068E2048|nr:NfeD family protein [Caldanaerobius polysaccharolyticus]